jgi:transposase-like protein
MTINKRSKEVMEVVKSIAEPLVSPISTAAASADMEVVAQPKRRHFSNADKRRIVAAADRCTLPGQLGALMRREGIYSSSLSAWRRLRQTAELAALAPQKRGPKVNPERADALHIAQLMRENDRLKGQLDKARLVIEVQKKGSSGICVGDFRPF